MRYFAMLLALCVTGAGASAQEGSPAAPPKELQKLESFSTANTECGVNPCDDFFAYATGNGSRRIRSRRTRQPGAWTAHWSSGTKTLLVKTLEQASATTRSVHQTSRRWAIIILRAWTRRRLMRTRGNG